MEQLCPPTVIAKLAVPLVLGVPVMIYTTEPELFVKLPTLTVAVSPTTPVELMLWAAYEPPFPPVYGTLILTLFEAIPDVKVFVWKEDPQLSVLMEPTKSFMQRTEKPFARLPSAGNALLPLEDKLREYVPFTVLLQ